jgi:hypothetical protein
VGSDSIRAVLASCTLSTRFAVRSDRAHYQISVAVSDLLGHLARSTRLNDSVLIYALKQIGADYGDVYVCDFIEKRPSLPDIPRWSAVCCSRSINSINTGASWL